jgi:ribokinase
MGRVVVAGSINMDVVATASRHPLIGETVAGHAVHYFPGGKGANQAVAAAKLGAPTTLIGRLGKDAFGRELRAFLAAQGIDLTFVQETAEAHTGTAIITVAHADNTIVVVPGANALVTATDVAAAALAKGDIAVSQFEIPLPAISAFFKRARAAGAITVLNPAPAIEFDAEMLDLVDILILNETELGFLAKTELRESDDHARFIEAAHSLPIGEDKIICVTLGKRGVLALLAGEPLIVAGRAVKAVDTTGAGDCFVGAVAAQLAGGSSITNALDYANAAASICVQRMGAAPSMPTKKDVEATLSARRPGEFLHESSRRTPGPIIPGVR